MFFVRMFASNKTNTMENANKLKVLFTLRSNKELTIQSLNGFINTHYVELTTNPDCDVVELYNEWAEVNL